MSCHAVVCTCYTPATGFADPAHTTPQDLVAERGAVFFMYPKANTSGCTKQACGFRDNYGVITEAGFDVYGLSFDAPKVRTLSS